MIPKRCAMVLIAAMMLGLSGCRREKTAAPPGPGKVESEVAVVAFEAPAPNSCEPPRPQYACRRATGAIAVDGDLAEWADVPAIALDQQSQARSDSGKWGGPADCSGAARLCFDGDFLYMAFDVTDDVHSQRYPEIADWAGDCVQFAIDALEDRTPAQYAADDHEFTISLTKDGPRISRWSTLRKGEVKGAKLAFVRGEGTGGVRYELAIPWDELTPLAPGLRKSFGFSFTFNDSDGKDMKAWLEWTDGICSGKNPAAFGQVLLDYAPPAAGEADLFLAGDVPRKPDVEALMFRLCRAVSQAERLRADLKLDDADNRTLATLDVAIPLEPGVSVREVQWRFPELPDGSYHGSITVTPPDGRAATRAFDYERLITTPWRERAKSVEARLKDLAKSRPELHAKCAPDVEYRLQVARCWMDNSTDVERWRNVPALMDETQRIVDTLEKGTDAFATRRGRLCRAYLAPEDDSPQPYRVEVPDDYDGSKPYPLVVLLHGYGGNTLTFDLWWHLANKGTAEKPRPGYLAVIPYGRGNAGWRLLASNDVFHVIDAMKRDYRIDGDRVCVQGFSMGGSGTWSIATDHPDQWSACGPQAGGVGLGAWEKFKENGPAADDVRARMSVAGSSMFRLENLLNVPTAVYHGIDDQTVGYVNSDAAFARLRELRHEAVLMAAVREGHSMPAPLRDGLVDWMLKFRRDAAPKKVVFRTADYRTTKAYWVEIDELIEEYRLAEVKADWSKPGRIDVETRNIRRLTLTLAPERLKDAATLTIAVNGSEAGIVDGLGAGKELHLLVADDGKSWRTAGERWREGLIKRRGMCGPMSEAMGGRFLFVVGTIGGGEATKANRKTAESLAGRMNGVTWGQFYANFRIRTDAELSDGDAVTSNLILFGGSESNAYVRKIAAGLPIRLEDGKLVFRGKTLEDPDAAVRFIYPNPANPARYVVVHCGATPAALAGIRGSILGEPDWAVFTKAGTETGLFDQDWK